MARKLTSALVIAAFGFTSSVGALGLGNIDSASTLNQPLVARIPLLSVSPDELSTLNVRLATSEAFERAGLDRPFYLSRLKFQVATGDDGRPYIAVTTDQPVKEPFLDFLVDVRWPRGRLVREYTVLLDPPIYEPGDAVAPAVAASPAAAPADRPQQPAEAPAPRGSGVTAGGASPQGAQASRGSVQEIDGSPAVAEYGPVQSNETLWGVAQAVRPDESLTINQTMLALLRANPDAFIDNNMNALRRGAVLRVPERGEIQQASPGEALREVREQYAEWQRRRNEALVAAGPADAPASEAAAADEPEAPAPPEAVTEAAAQESEAGKLTLVAPEDSSSEQATSSLTDRELAATEANVDRLQSRLSVLEEGNASLEAENQDLKSQMVAMREELSALRSMVNLQMQQGLAAGDAAEGQPGPEAATAAEAEAEAVEPPAGETAAGDAAATAEDIAAGTDQAMAEETAGDMAAAPEEAMEAPPEAGEAEAMLADEPTETAGGTASAPPADTGGAVAPEPEPAVATQDTAQPAPAAEPEPAGPLQGVLAALPDTRLLGLAGAGLLGLLGLLVVARRRRAAATEGAAEELPEPSLGPGPLDDDTTVAPAAADGDAVSQADVYIAYGNLDRAQEVLDEALGEDPDNKTLRLKLLDVLARQGDRGGFEAEAQVLHTQIADHDSPEWQEVVAKGRTLAPEHPLFRERQAPAGGQADGAGDSRADEDDFALDFELDLPPEEEPSGPSQEELAAGIQPDPFSEDVAEDDDGSGLDFDLGELRPQSTTEQPLDLRETELPEAQTSSRETSAGGGDDLDFELPDLDSLGFADAARGSTADTGAGDDDSGDALQDDEPLDEAGTKLDLARAYLDMGDADGARSLLDEVVQEGDDQQRRMAEELLRQAS